MKEFIVVLVAAIILVPIGWFLWLIAKILKLAGW